MTRNLRSALLLPLLLTTLAARTDDPPPLRGFSAARSRDQREWEAKFRGMSLDNRGTPSLRGREWRKCIYRKFGLLVSDDQAGAARTIGRWKWVDSTRLGIWGWSGGGSTTLNVLFRDPEVYRMGMAVAPVPDVHLYDTIYQERYMGLPQQNEEDYKRSSPLNFAANLKAKLLVVHGSGDDNVHYQGTERLINALVAANRPFTMPPSGSR